MRNPHPLYRALIRLYPRDFRREYGEDLVAHYAELVADRGAHAARTRTTVDLIVTLPRYHLEHVMTEQHSATALSSIIGLLAVGGAASVLTGVGPGLVLFGLAAVLAIAQRSTLARALRVPDSELRRHRLITSAVLAAIFVVSFTVYILLIGDSWGARETVLTIIGTIAMVGSAGFFIAGLLTPRTPARPAPA